MLLLIALIGLWIWAWPESKDEKWFREIGQELISGASSLITASKRWE